jgi:hypothetical protein
MAFGLPVADSALAVVNEFPVNRTRRRKLSTHVGKTHRERRTTMPLLQAVEILVVVGVLLWLVNRFIPMQSSIKSILNGVVVIAVVVWLLNAFGLFHSLSRMHIGS